MVSKNILKKSLKSNTAALCSLWQKTYGSSILRQPATEKVM